MTLVPLPDGAVISFAPNGSVTITSSNGGTMHYTADEWSSIETGMSSEPKTAPGVSSAEAANLVADALRISTVLI